MTREDIDNIISIICPNDEDFEKPIISPAYLKKELEVLALEQEPQPDIEAIRQIAENELKKFPQLGNAARSIRTIIEEIDKHIQKGGKVNEILG